MKVKRCIRYNRKKSKENLMKKVKERMKNLNEKKKLSDYNRSEKRSIVKDEKMLIGRQMRQTINILPYHI